MSTLNFTEMEQSWLNDCIPLSIFFFLFFGMGCLDPIVGGPIKPVGNSSGLPLQFFTGFSQQQSTKQFSLSLSLIRTSSGMLIAPHWTLECYRATEGFKGVLHWGSPASDDI